MDDEPSFGRWLKQRRKQLDMTQDDVARQVGCSVVTIAKVESGDRRPSKQIAELIFEVLEIPPDERPALLRMARREQVERGTHAVVDVGDRPDAPGDSAEPAFASSAILVAPTTAEQPAELLVAAAQLSAVTAPVAEGAPPRSDFARALARAAGLRSAWPAVALTIAAELGCWLLYVRWRGLWLVPGWRYALVAALIPLTAWLWQSWRAQRRSRARLAASVVLSLLLALAGWSTWLLTRPAPFPPESFGILVAELGEGADFERTPRTREMSGQIYEHLCAALSQQAGPPGGSCTPGNAPVALGKVGVIPDSQTAQSLASQLNADLVIWGQLLSPPQQGATLRFHGSSTLDWSASPDFPIVQPLVVRSPSALLGETNLPPNSLALKDVVARQSLTLSSFSLGLLHLSRRNFPAAALQFENAARLIDEDAQGTLSPEVKGLVYFYVGHSYSLMSRDEEGLRWLKRARAASPSEPAIVIAFALSKAREQQGRRSVELGLALTLIKDWLQLHPGDPLALFDRGQVAMLQNQTRDALADFEAVIAADPAYFPAYISGSRAAVDLGEPDRAVDMLRAAISLREQTGGNPVWAYLNLALVFRETGELDQAREHYQTARRLAPYEPWIAHYYAQFLEEQGEYDAALELYQTAVETAADKLWVYAELGHFLRRRGLYDRALEAYNQAVREDHTNPQPYLFIAELYEQQQNNGAAERMYETALSVAKDRSWVYVELGHFLRRHGKLDRALEAYDQALDEDRSNALTYTWLAEVAFALGDLEVSVQHYEEALALSREIPYVLGSYAAVRYQLGDFEGAALLYEEVLALEPTNSAALKNLALTYRQLGDCPQAEAIYHSMTADPESFTPEDVQVARNELAKISPCS